MITDEIREKLARFTAEKNDLEAKLLDPETASDSNRIREVGMKLAEIREPAELYAELLHCEKTLREAKELLNDPEMRDLAEEEIANTDKRIESIEEKLKKLMAPKDPNDEKEAILEIRPGTGGDEAALFAAELMRAYLRFAESKRFSVEILEKNENEAGGLKEAIFEIAGRGAYGTFKFEGGVHRVQRIPVTESQGRIHTSAVSVVVLPKIEEAEFKINESDLKFDVFRSSGPGGQSVNTTDSAVRITHLPTGTVVTCQDEKSQHKNKARALSVLRSRLAAIEEEKKAQELGKKRLSQIGSGDRSDKIRTYNFPQDRVTDHRITSGKKNFSNIPAIMGGDFEDIVETLQEEESRFLESE